MIVRIASGIAVILLASAFETTAETRGGLPEAIAQRYDLFHQAEVVLEVSRPPNFSQALANHYAEYIAPYQDADILAALPAASVNLLFSAAYDTAFYSDGRRYAGDMEADLARLRVLQADEPRHYEDIYAALIRTRDFPAAKSVLASQPAVGSNVLPGVAGTLVEGSGPSALVLSEDGSSISQQPIVLSGPLDIVVVGHPSCHFSNDAVAAIEANPRLKAVFTRYSRWVMPQDGNMQPRRVADWNAAHSAARMSYIYRQADWPAIDYWGTPTFYFFRDGKRVGKLVGWPPNGEGEMALRKELEKLGLL